MNGKLFLTMGTPGAGKSSFLRDHVKDPHTQVIVSRDAIRFRMVRDEEPYFSKEDEVFKEYMKQINYFLSEGYDVYADATHLNKKSRAKVLRNLTVKPREVSVIWLWTPLEECIRCNEFRAGTRSYVPPTEIRRMASRLQVPTFDEDIDKIYIVKPNEPIKIIDLMEG